MAYGVSMLMTRHALYSCNAYPPNTSGKAGLIELAEWDCKKRYLLLTDNAHGACLLP